MGAKLSAGDKEWYFDAIEKAGAAAVTANRAADTVTYASAIRSHESHVKSADPEELAHAVLIALLASAEYKYPLSALGHEIHYAHGSKGSKADEVDVLIWDPDGVPYAMCELKAASEYSRDRDDAIKNQLFGTAPLVGAPKLLIYATVEPRGAKPKIKALCIDYTKYKSYEAWKDAGAPHSSVVPTDYQDLGYEPLISHGKNDLVLDSTQADFRAIASGFHNEFFGEHADNTIFVNLVKCLLAKIHDERTRKKGEPYDFQVFQKNGRPDSAMVVFKRVNALYSAAYKRYIDQSVGAADEINPKEFSEDRVKTVVQALQAISITKGAARHGDVIGAFFEEILRAGFKQDRGMYFTHDNIVRFIIEAVDLGELTKRTWRDSTHPENRLPYVIDPACGSGNFLLHAMSKITETVKGSAPGLVVDHDSEQFYKARFSDDQPNYWAENFVYGMDPKFIMAITAKVNMVLHGDGSAHVFKDDAFKPFDLYTDRRLQRCNDSQRSMGRSRYAPDVCETFDVVVSNPPFGITIAAETRATLVKSFQLPESTPSEGLFLERCFQLLKPGGRLGIVVPESVLNAKEMIEVRHFLFRCFTLRAIVTMPRNIFIDTPTLTSLVFAQKKTKEELAIWDAEWTKQEAVVEAAIKNARAELASSRAATRSAGAVAADVMRTLLPIVGPGAWVTKGGKTPAVLRFERKWAGEPGPVAAKYFVDIMRTAEFREICRRYVFKNVVASIDYSYPTFVVDEIGYKLSKRREKARPNPLMTLRGRVTKQIITNLHLAQEPCEVVTAAGHESVLRSMRKTVKWTTS